ncbi:hypothetical protein Zmor_021134 [Zophobas morio]|uniref:Uncharacterized protein n=1 Tax=Zophobas morio TaxID=2755281 RepID=A0AA38MB36_9CUCU|nr:hypothetical protein Zmor_021134 [Zophobas morio]
MTIFFLSLRTESLLGAAIIIIFAAVKTALISIYPFPEAPQTVVVLNIVIQTLGALILIVGVLKEDRVCIITFLCFNICGIIIQALGLLTQYYVLSDEKVKLSLVIVLVMEHVPLIYMIPTGVDMYKAVRAAHMRLADSLSTSRAHERMVHPPNSNYIPGIGL